MLRTPRGSNDPTARSLPPPSQGVTATDGGDARIITPYTLRLRRPLLQPSIDFSFSDGAWGRAPAGGAQGWQGAGGGASEVCRWQAAGAAPC